jgi:hypothetical protein
MPGFDDLSTNHHLAVTQRIHCLRPRVGADLGIDGKSPELSGGNQIV